MFLRRITFLESRSEGGGIGGSRTAAGGYPYSTQDCEADTEGSRQSVLCGLVWRDQNKDQLQNVFKRFLFHYSKAQNSVGSVQRESHSVHPLMRLSSNLSQRKKKQQMFASQTGINTIFLLEKLKTACGPSPRLGRDLLCSIWDCHGNAGKPKAGREAALLYSE
ncbi:uncharacterized protein nms [Chanos chanos]|uniref:Uncharacterized protein nms n=1 Tax=Chanos chanos TaxID=29144 RepID=A0A6J2WDX2_CHACN|nr:neuromedin-S [Chanos chanos]